MNAYLLAVRALNELRLLHQPAYVALRYLLDSSVTDKGTQSTWLRDALCRKLVARVRPRFLSTERFKKVRADGEVECRPFVVPSPSTCLGEALLLSALSQTPAFASHPRVFSYQWPQHARSTRNFSYYLPGYRERDRQIVELLAAGTDEVAIVVDIKKFYPNANRDVVRQKFRNQADDAHLRPELRELAHALVDQLLHPSVATKGIPIGPDLSHLLGNLALTDADAVFTKQFDNRYLRYVDDIVVVVPRSQKAAARNLLSETLAKEGLELNEDKDDCVDAATWQRNAPSTGGHSHPASFESLRQRLTNFLALQPGRYDELKGAFESEGFSLPLPQFRSSAGYGPLRRWLKAMHRQGGRHLWQAWRDDVTTLLEVGRQSRDEMVHHFESLLAAPESNQPTLQRWSVQRLRYCVNRLFYLLPESRYRWLLERIERMPDFAEITALLQAIITGDVQSLLRMPGSAVSVFGERCRRVIGTKLRFSPMHPLTPGMLDSLGALLLHGVCEVEPKAIEGSAPETRELLDFCAGRASPARTLDDLSFVDELRSLQLKRTHADGVEFLSSRYSDDEDLSLDALRLGGHYYR